MSLELTIMLVFFISLLCLRVPIAFVLGLITVVTALALGYNNIPLTCFEVREFVFL